MAIAGMILGIVSIVPCVACGGPFFALIGLVLSIQALYTIRRQPAELDGRGMAIAGITTSIIGLLLGLIIILLFTFFSSALRALGPIEQILPIEKPLPP